MPDQVVVEDGAMITMKFTIVKEPQKDQDLRSVDRREDPVNLSGHCWRDQEAVRKRMKVNLQVNEDQLFP